MNYYISDTVIKTMLTKIEYFGTVAQVTTPVEYWFKQQGGRAAGTIYVTLLIDLYSGKVLESYIS